MKNSFRLLNSEIGNDPKSFVVCTTEKFVFSSPSLGDR